MLKMFKDVTDNLSILKSELLDAFNTALRDFETKPQTQFNVELGQYQNKAKDVLDWKPPVQKEFKLKYPLELYFFLFTLGLFMIGSGIFIDAKKEKILEKNQYQNIHQFNHNYSR